MPRVVTRAHICWSGGAVRCDRVARGARSPAQGTSPASSASVGVEEARDPAVVGYGMHARRPAASTRPIVARVAEPKMIAIVGSGPGLVSALARRFARPGWSVALVALHQEVIDAGLAELERFGVHTFGARADVTDRLAVARAFG